MENTIENKQKFFALYGVLGKEETLLLNPLSQITDDDIDMVVYFFLKKDYVKRNVIEWLEDRTAVYVTYDKCRGFPGDKYDVLEMSIVINTEKGYIDHQYAYRRGNGTGIASEQTHNVLACYDYLRSKSYLLPYMDLSCEDIVSYGWAKLKQNSTKTEAETIT